MLSEKRRAPKVEVRETPTFWGCRGVECLHSSGSFSDTPEGLIAPQAVIIPIPQAGITALIVCL